MKYKNVTIQELINHGWEFDQTQFPDTQLVVSLFEDGSLDLLNTGETIVPCDDPDWLGKSFFFPKEDADNI